MKAFSHFKFQTGHVAELDRQFPSELWALDAGAKHDGKPLKDTIDLPEGYTYFGYIHRGAAHIEKDWLYTVPEHTAFCVPGPFSLRGYDGKTQAIIVGREGFNGMLSITGPLERRGRLRYIDGCTDSLLIPPVILGDPCLNLLYFPPGIDQTRHTHPSDRIGLVMSGRGMCHAWDSPDGPEQRIELVPGMLFCIHTNGLHKFSTMLGDEMRVLAYHPDSDFGPQHENHPMLNRTIVDGVSASKIEAIHTDPKALSALR